jgi:hypothetical protein
MRTRKTRVVSYEGNPEETYLSNFFSHMQTLECNTGSVTVTRDATTTCWILSQAYRVGDSRHETSDPHAMTLLAERLRYIHRLD